MLDFPAIDDKDAVRMIFGMNHGPFLHDVDLRNPDLTNSFGDLEIRDKDGGLVWDPWQRSR
jgi:hypothetical protein